MNCYGYQAQDVFGSDCVHASQSEMMHMPHVNLHSLPLLAVRKVVATLGPAARRGGMQPACAAANLWPTSRRAPLLCWWRMECGTELSQMITDRREGGDCSGRSLDLYRSRPRGSRGVLAGSILWLIRRPFDCEQLRVNVSVSSLSSEWPERDGAHPMGFKPIAWPRLESHSPFQRHRPATVRPLSAGPQLSVFARHSLDAALKTPRHPQ